MDLSATPMSWKARGYTLPLQDRVLIMGVLNVTPDSFSDGGRYLGVEAAVARAEEIEAEGADLLDLGGESSRPGSQPVPLDVELARVLPVLAALAGRIRIPISVDTTKAEVARRALDAGAAIINDISALRHDPEMADAVAQAHAGPLPLDLRGTPVGRPAEEREWGTAAAVAVGVFQGAQVVRVHSIAQMKDVARVAQALRDQMPVNRYSLNVKREALEGDNRCIPSLHD